MLQRMGVHIKQYGNILCALENLAARALTRREIHPLNDLHHATAGIFTDTGTLVHDEGDGGRRYACEFCDIDDGELSHVRPDSIV